MLDRVQYLLLQVRNRHDPMRDHEVGCFARTLECPRERIRVFDLLGGVPSPGDLQTADVVLLGGAGEYSVAKGGDWLLRALEAMRELHDLAKPTFASCWGFQAMARALGGEVVNDRSRAEVGTHHVRLTAAGQSDPLFAPWEPYSKPRWATKTMSIACPRARSAWPRPTASPIRRSVFRGCRSIARSFIRRFAATTC